MNSKLIIAFFAIIFATVSAQYYYPYGSYYGGYYNGLNGYVGNYAGYAAAYPGYASYYPSAFATSYYGFGSNKNKGVESQQAQSNVKLTNNS
ncbi:Hypothetical protein SRAE_2000476800 [Strongyloides ratti]|uniref:Uncharacterized protein n=1 Tax=Strongyloides ratti TaxID=34506 RepID=A0A090LRA6_STRRB|nr:Hypothetical protein SRAE_2000476800 [Strongyloides ratti]CEF70131.1 Hypothetical protein SRAE_2000476800 [Strongyloides ratti]